MTAHPGCWSCALARGDLDQHITEWFYIGPEGAVVQDLDAKGHAMRLLYVPCKHQATGDRGNCDLAAAKRLLLSVGYAVATEKQLKLGELDLGDDDDREHWLAWLYLDYPEDMDELARLFMDYKLPELAVAL